MDVNEAVRKLRDLTGESQQAFATRLRLSIRAVVNYEKDRTPAPKALAAMAHLARKHGAPDLANLFWSALPEELQAMPVISANAGEFVKDDANVMYKMLPRPLPPLADEGTEVALTEIRPTISRCLQMLDSLIEGQSPAVSGPPAKAITAVRDDLKRLVKLYGRKVTAIPAKVEFVKATKR